MNAEQLLTLVYDAVREDVSGLIAERRVVVLKAEDGIAFLQADGAHFIIKVVPVTLEAAS